MPKEKAAHGGPGRGQGRKLNADKGLPVKRPLKVYLAPADYDWWIAEGGSETAAVVLKRHQAERE